LGSTAEDHASETRVQHGARAHQAGFERDVERAAIEPVIAQRPCRLAQGPDFGMRRGVVPGHRSIPAGGKQLTGPHHHGAHGNLALRRGHARALQCEPHPVLVT